MENSCTKKNIVVFGETGSGKSSIVNMLLGEPKANVSDSAVGCTFEFHCYSTDEYNIYDTIGLSEGKRGTISASYAVVNLLRLLRSLKDGVNLLIFVVKKDRITKSCEDNYNLFANAICVSQVPILLVVTHCESERQVGTWWTGNQVHFDNYGMTFQEVISGCGNPGVGEEVHPGLAPRMNEIYEETRRSLTDAVLKNALGTGFAVTFRKWVTMIFLNVVNIIRRWFKEDELAYSGVLYECLKQHVNCDEEAKEISNQAVELVL